LISDEDVEKAIDYLRDNAETAAQASANRVYIEQYRKSLKAQLRQKAPVRAQGDKDDFAYAHPEYLDLLDGLKVAVFEHEQHRYLIAAAQAKIEAWRTQSSNQRALATLS